jgi:hypothetical protein
MGSADLGPKKNSAPLDNARVVRHSDCAAGRNFHARRPVKHAEKKRNKIMGDRSPKSNQKKSSQKTALASSASSKKAQAVAAKQAAGKKR